MVTLTFDTYAFIKRLKESGVSEEQAEAHSEALKQFQQSSLDELATKKDLADVKTGLAEVKTDLAVLKGELNIVKLMLGILLGGMVSLLVKAFG